MKEITTDVKRRIFGLYLGQNINKYRLSKLSGWKIKEVGFGAPFGYLLVKSLLSITDEDAIAVIKLYRAVLTPMGLITEHSLGGVKIFKETILSMERHPQQATDYLRSKGYALPYLHWSVEDLVEAGIFKLI